MIGPASNAAARRQTGAQGAAKRTKPIKPERAEQNRKGRPSRDEQSRRQDVLLDVALDEFQAEGFGGANIETIARKAGVGKSTIYRNYKTKQGLLLAVAQRRMAELGARWCELSFDLDDPEGTLYQIAQMGFDEWSGKSLPIYRIIFTEATRLPELARVVHDLSLTNAVWPVTDYFQQLQDHGTIAVRDMAEAVSTFLTIAVGGTRFLIMPSQLDDAARDQLARDAVQFFLHGCSTRGPRSSSD